MCVCVCEVCKKLSCSSYRRIGFISFSPSSFHFFFWEPAKGKLHRSVINRLLPSLQSEVPRRVLKSFFF